MASINVDFVVVPSGDPKYILVVDTSEWAHIINKTSIIEVTMPGKRTYATQYFDKGKVNIFNSQNLGYTCSGSGSNLIDLPDGVYKITVKGSPDSFSKTRYYLRTEVIEYELAKLFIDNGLRYTEIDSETFDELHNKVELNLKDAKIFIMDGDIQRANYHLNEAQSIVEKYKNCKDCK